MSDKYYQNLHDTNPAYQSNNWMLPEIGILKELGLESILEIGCGNGKFLDEFSKYCNQLIGVDFAVSPVFPKNDKIKFFQKNLLKDDLPFKTDMVVSADVLEHFKLEDIPNLIKKLETVSASQYHVIACYDDGHSHETVLTPNEWLTQFQLVSPKYKLGYIRERKGKEICLIHNLRI